MHLSELDIRLLGFIRNFIEDNGYSPTYDELALLAGVDSHNTVKDHIYKLKRLGLVNYREGLQRTLTLTGYRVKLEKVG